MWLIILKKNSFANISLEIYTLTHKNKNILIKVKLLPKRKKSHKIKNKIMHKFEQKKDPKETRKHIQTYLNVVTVQISLEIFINHKMKLFFSDVYSFFLQLFYRYCVNIFNLM